MPSLDLSPSSVAGTVFRAPSPVVNSAAVQPARTVRTRSGRLGTSRRKSDDKRSLKSFRDQAALTDENLRLAGAEILSAYGLPSAKAVGCCGMHVQPQAGVVTVKLNRTKGRASYGGLMRCSNVWACQICSKRISRARCEEVNVALSAARTEGLSVYLATFTFSHRAGDDLKTILKGMTEARRRLAQRAEWRALPLVGSISAVEVTYGASGHHPHVHQLVFLSGDPAGHAKLLKRIGPAWRRSLQAFGLEGGKAAYQWQDGSAAGDYIAKSWQAAEELTLASMKTGGKAGSRTPAQLLADAALGCRKSAAIWAEYAGAFHGKRQLVWSRGLKARFKIGEKSDAEAAEDAEQPADDVVTVWTFSPAEWSLVRSRKLAILRAAERGACLHRAMFGPSDRDRWRRYVTRDADPVFLP